MNIEKLKPWNWFKHEDDTVSQIPVSKNEASNQAPQNVKSHSTAQYPEVGSLLKLHQDMERLFDDVWRSFGMSSLSRLPRSATSIENSTFGQALLGDYQAKLDVSGSDKEYEVSIDLPGLSENDIQLELSGNTLLIKGQKEETTENKNKQYYRVERSVGSFQRTLSLPDDAIKDDISAQMKNGLLLIKIPRNPLPKEDVKRISISS